MLGHARRCPSGFATSGALQESHTASRARPAMRQVLRGSALFFLTFFLATGLLAAFALRWPGIYPGVRVDGLDLGGADRATAATQIAAVGARWEATALTVGGPAGTIELPRQALGLHYDREAMLAAALAPGRDGALPARLAALFDLWWQGRDLPVLYTVDEALLSARLGDMAGATDIQPRDGDLRIEAGHVIITPAVEGRGLDQAAAAQLLREVAASGATTVTLPVAEGIQPRITAITLADAQARAEGLLAAPVQLRGAGLDRSFDPAAIGSWLTVRHDTASATPLTIAIDPAKVRATLTSVAPAVRRDTLNAAYEYNERLHAFVVTAPALEGRQLNLDRTVALVLTALDRPTERVVTPATDRWRPGLNERDIVVANRLAERSYLAGPLSYSWANERWLLTVPQLAGWLTILPGQTPEAGPRLVFDEKALATYIAGLQGQIDLAAVDATYTLDDGSDVYRLTGPSRVGRALDTAAALKVSLAALRGDTAARDLPLTVNELRPAITEADVAALQPERWIDVDLTTQRMNAVVGKKVIYTATISSGKKGWETPTGTYHIMYRVENETMTSESIGAEEFYRLENVLYTQYFTNEGHALHYSWWKTPESFGTPSSHGCVSETLKDAEYFWNFANVGTRVTIRGVSPT